jgi:uncharacterized protein involved in exopolysaccharide biosynthesis
MMGPVSPGPPLFLIVAAVLATLLLVAVVLFVVRAVRREQRGLEVTPPDQNPRHRRDPTP